MASIPCFTKTVTLQPNEPFNLPPGAILLGATDLNNLKSTCPLPTDLEEFECYGFVTFDSNCGDDSGFAASILEGINIGGVKYPFTNPIRIDEGDYFVDGGPTPALAAAVQTALQSTPIGGAFIDFYAYSDDWDESGTKANIYLVCWKSIPSLNVNSYIYGYGTSDGPTIPVSWPITKPSDTGLDPRMYAGCPCAST
jgi:hypothetical protein